MCEDVVRTLAGFGMEREKAAEVTAILQRGRGEGAWREISQRFLNPSQDFTMHVFLYEGCYGKEALLKSPGPAWFPSDEIVARANVTTAAKEAGVAGYEDFWRWSVENREAFWELAVRRLGIRMHTPYTRMLDATAPTQPRWMVGGRMNIIESCFQAEAELAAVVELDRAGKKRTVSYGELLALSRRVAQGLKGRGIGPGDAVAMIGPMTSETVASYLGVILTGAAVVSIADSFAAEEIAARLRIAKAKLLITQDFVAWGSKKLALYEKVAGACGVPAVVIAGEGSEVALRAGDTFWTELLRGDGNFSAVQRDPGDAVNILFSSGTTGEPKAIPWDHTTPIKCAADAHFHHDLKPGDVVCWPTNMGWMMGPWLIFATLLNRCTMALYPQAPTDRGFGMFVQEAKVTMLGLVPSLVRAWRNSDCMRGLDWSSIRAFSSSGECSSAPDMLWLMHLAGYRPVIEYCGGTEIGGGYISSTMVQPNVPGAFSTAALGIDIAIEDGERVMLVSQRAKGTSMFGEAFIVGPSMGLSTRLLNKDHEGVYFSDVPLGSGGEILRRHSDELEILPSGYFRIAGRSDDTMNLGGIKVSCAEIERVLTGVDGILETAAVASSPKGGGPSQLVVFAVLRAGVTKTADELKAAMQAAIRSGLNPLFRVEQVVVVPALPRTASNKVLRRELRRELTADKYG